MEFDFFEFDVVFFEDFVVLGAENTVGIGYSTTRKLVWFFGKKERFSVAIFALIMMRTCDSELSFSLLKILNSILVRSETNQSLLTTPLTVSYETE